MNPSSATITNSEDDNYVPSLPINFNTSSTISGEESQILEVQLRKNQTLRAESGAMLYMTDGVVMNTTMGKGGMSDGFRRMLTGQNLFVSDFTFEGKKEQSDDEEVYGTVALGTDFPSKIIRFDLDEWGGSIICQRGAYLAASDDVGIEMEFTKKLGVGFFGGEGFVLQRLVGDGVAFVKAGGVLVKRELTAGESLRVSSGSIVAFSSGVDYDIQMMPGFKNVVFGGEGLFITTLSGPGTVWLQGMPPDRMISEIARRVPGGGIGLGVPIGLGGGGEGGEEGSPDAPEDSDVAGEDMVAASDAAVEADRNATVASSGLSDGTSGDAVTSETGGLDPNSPEALFGDAAPKPDNDSGIASSSSSTNDDYFDDSTSFSSDDSSSTSFGEDPANNMNDFQDDTQFSTLEEDQQASSDSYDDGSGGGDEDSGGGFLRTLWDFFND